jgi:hypothetical protein
MLLRGLAVFAIVERLTDIRGLLLGLLIAIFAAVESMAGATAQEARLNAAADGEFKQFGIYAQSAPRALAVEPVATNLPLQLNKGDRIALIGNTLLERSQEFGHIEAMLHQKFPELHLVVRHLAWSGDEVGLQPRPANFADTEQHLAHEKIDVIFAAVGFNESFAGEEAADKFRVQLITWLTSLKTKAFNGKSAPRIVLISPIANENLAHVPAADRNNASIRKYAEVIQAVAAQEQVGFVEVFTDTEAAMVSPGSDLTINGIHLNREGDKLFSSILFRKTFGVEPSEPSGELLTAIVDKNQQYFRRFRPLNTFYYTGGRNKDYGYLDFLPAMRNFDLMVENRDQRIWSIAAGQTNVTPIDDANLPPLPAVSQSRGANEWMSAADELKEMPRTTSWSFWKTLTATGLRTSQLCSPTTCTFLWRSNSVTVACTFRNSHT